MRQSKVRFWRIEIAQILNMLQFYMYQMVIQNKKCFEWFVRYVNLSWKFKFRAFSVWTNQVIQI